jgi:phosphinothricin acetyltransferase
MLVRPTNLEDAAGIAAIETESILNDFVHFGEFAVSEEEVREKILDPTRKHPWFTAWDGEVIGFARASVFRARPAYRWTTEVGIYVDPRHQNKGVGRALYAALLPSLEDAGYRTILAGITKPNEASERLHASFGFELTGVLPKVGYKQGAWRDVGWWAMTVGEGPPDTSQ